MSKTIEEILINITTKELVQMSGETFSDTKQFYTYANEMLERVAKQSAEAGRDSMKEEIEKKIKENRQIILDKLFIFD